MVSRNSIDPLVWPYPSRSECNFAISLGSNSSSKVNGCMPVSVKLYSTVFSQSDCVLSNVNVSSLIKPPTNINYYLKG